jgi:hypothetical protein
VWVDVNAILHASGTRRGFILCRIASSWAQSKA